MNENNYVKVSGLLGEGEREGEGGEGLLGWL